MLAKRARHEYVYHDYNAFSFKVPSLSAKKIGRKEKQIQDTTDDPKEARSKKQEAQFVCLFFNDGHYYNFQIE